MRHCNDGNMGTSTLHVDLGVHKQRSALAKTLIIDHKSEKWQSKCLRRFTIQWHCQSSRYGLLIIQCSPNGHACNANSVQNMNSKFQQLCGTDQQDSEIVWSYMEENWPPLEEKGWSYPLLWRFKSVTADSKFSTRMTCHLSKMGLFMHLKSIYSAQNLHAFYYLRTIL